MRRTLLYISTGTVLLLGAVLLWHVFPNALFSSNSSAAAGAVVATSSVISGTIVNPQALATAAPPPDGYVEYRNDKYGFSFYHSPEGVIHEYDEGGGAMTVTLENLARVRGLQIFIVPYANATISEERFHKDVPSGVRTNVENTTLDGVKAVTFNSTDALLGDTREVWTINNGYLYEVTTFKGVALWFTPIMQTWRWL